jgi:hypothetical protein
MGPPNASHGGKEHGGGNISTPNSPIKAVTDVSEVKLEENFFGQETSKNSTHNLKKIDQIQGKATSNSKNSDRSTNADSNTGSLSASLTRTSTSTGMSRNGSGVTQPSAPIPAVSPESRSSKSTADDLDSSNNSKTNSKDSPSKGLNESSTTNKSAAGAGDSANSSNVNPSSNYGATTSLQLQSRTQSRSHAFANNLDLSQWMQHFQNFRIRDLLGIPGTHHTMSSAYPRNWGKKVIWKWACCQVRGNGM